MCIEDAAAEKFCKISAASCFRLRLIVKRFKAMSCRLFPRLLAIELITYIAALSETLEQFKVIARSADRIPFWLRFCGDGENQIDLQNSLSQL